MAERQDEKPGEKPWPMLLLAAGAVLITLLAGWMLYAVVGLDELERLLSLIWERLQTAPPFAFFAVVLIASLLPIPVSVLYAAAGTLYGVTTALAWIAITAIVANLIVHFVCSSFLRPALVQQIEKRGHRIPKLESRSDESLLIAFVRITPAFPYFLQNWMLGLADVEIVRFLAITLAIHMLQASGFVILGRSAFEGELGMAAAGVALLVVVSIVARVAHRRIQANRADKLDPSSE